MLGFRRLEANVGLAGGLLRLETVFDEAVLLAEVVVDLFWFVEAVVGLFSVDGRALGVVVDLVVLSGFLAVLEVVERLIPGVGSFSSCALDDERSMLCGTAPVKVQCRTEFHFYRRIRSNIPSHLQASTT